MTYNTDLQSHITRLQNIINTTNDLPDAGGVELPELINEGTAADMLSGKQLINSDGNVVTGAMPTISAKTWTPTTSDQTITSGRYLIGTQIIKGDGNLIASNIKNGTSIFGVTGNYEGSGGSGGEDRSAELIDGTCTSWENSEVSKIRPYAFCSCTSLTKASFPAATTIDSCAFRDCYSLKTLSFPNVTLIGSGAFSSCSSLTTASFPAATSISASAFYGCEKLTTISFPKVTTIGSNAFYYCESLTTASFPAATSINASAFYNCEKLTTISFPKAKTIGSYAFRYCSSLTTVSFPVTTSIYPSAFRDCYSLKTLSFPKVTLIGSGAFYNCTSLTTASFPAAKSISSYAFSSCGKLNSVYLAGSSLCSLANSNAFSNTGIASNKGCIYVPNSLVTSYKAATNWAYFSAVISAIDGVLEDSDFD